METPAWHEEAATSAVKPLRGYRGGQGPLELSTAAPPASKAGSKHPCRSAHEESGTLYKGQPIDHSGGRSWERRAVTWALAKAKRGGKVGGDPPLARGAA